MCCISKHYQNYTRISIVPLSPACPFPYPLLDSSSKVIFIHRKHLYHLLIISVQFLQKIIPRNKWTLIGTLVKFLHFNVMACDHALSQDPLPQGLWKNLGQYILLKLPAVSRKEIWDVESLKVKILYIMLQFRPRFDLSSYWIIYRK